MLGTRQNGSFAHFPCNHEADLEQNVFLEAFGSVPLDSMPPGTTFLIFELTIPIPADLHMFAFSLRMIMSVYGWLSEGFEMASRPMASKNTGSSVLPESIMHGTGEANIVKPKKKNGLTLYCAKNAIFKK